MIKLNHELPVQQDGFNSDEKRYEWQMGIRAHYLLLGDKNFKLPMETFTAQKPFIKTSIRWIDRGELIAGSFMCNLGFSADVASNDVDIYFKSKDDANEFLRVNPQLNQIAFQSDIGMLIITGDKKMNLIYGVHYDSPDDLVSHFDIRACSIALEPTANTVHTVKGALWDAVQKHIVFNPIPHNTTVARLVKYAQKGFEIDPYQRLFFTELIKSDMYNPDLEISTGYRAVQK